MTTAAVPVPLEPLVGRRTELARLADLRRSARLITLRGPAGVGKSRLAVEYAGRAGIACWVDVAALTDLVAVGDLVLTGRKALLVLDNCEHLIDATARAAAGLLARHPDLTVLATSREALDLPGEVVMRLNPLPLPGSESGAEAVSRADAVALFVERARAAAPGFALTDANARVVAEICARLDGLPLAIELAARRVRLLGPAEVLRRLDDRFSLLADNRRAEGRHRDLRSAIAWSHDLLDEGEKALFERLSVFPGGFGLDAASAVAGIADPAVVLDRIDVLEAKSLLSFVDGRPGRFRLLESVRLFAGERLAASGALDETRQRALHWLVRLAEGYSQQAFPTADVLAPIEGERANLLAALAWEPAEKPLLAAAVAACHREHGRLAEGRSLLDSVLANGDHRGVALAQAALLATDAGDAVAARRFAAEAVALDRDAGSPGLVRSLSCLVGACLALGDVESADLAAREAVELATRPFDRLVCLHDLARVELSRGRTGEVAGLLAKCLTSTEPRLRVDVLHSAGLLALTQDDLDAAEAYFLEALTSAAEHGPRRIRPVEGLAVVAARRGDGPRAVRLGFAAEALRRTSGVAVSAREEQVSAAISGARAGMTRAQLRRAHDEGVALEGLAEYASGSSATGRAPLTEREGEIVRLVAAGFSSRRIAAELDIAERTVEAHLEKVRARLGLRSRAQLAAWWAGRH